MKNITLTEKLKNTFAVVYMVLLILFVGVVIYLASSCKEPSMKDDLYASARDFNSGWTVADGEIADISKLQDLDYGTYEEFSIFNTLPIDMDGHSSLYFRSKNIFFSVYIDGELVYKPYVPESAFYTDAFGTRWSCIPLSAECRGKTVEIRMVKVYESSRSSIDNICIGESGGVILNTLGSKMTAFITCILLLFTGLLLIIADIPANVQSHKNHELFYLGLFALSISTWCTSETNLIQFFFDDSRLMQVISCTSLMFIPIPMMLYLDSAFGFRWKWLTPAFCGVSITEILLCWILHFTGITDIHHTMTLTHIILGICAIIMFSVNIKNAFINKGNRSPVIYRILRGSGFVCVSAATFIDIIRYYLGGSTDSAMFVRIGLLIYIICYGISSLENTIKVVRKGIKAEIVGRLAYSDGLTGIGNRTAFMEMLSEIEKSGSDGLVGIVMFDVNDLKFVNDNLGHTAGDNMLIKSAEVIKSSFENYGSCFRIGGDEFVAVLKGGDVSKHYEKGIETFNAEINEHNNIPEKEFTLSIAHGFAVFDRKNTESTLKEVYEQADMLMYENKKLIKASRPKPLTAPELA